MKLHKQLYRHDPDNGVYGDCQRTVFACLLDKRRPEDVPHFAHDNPPSGVFWDRVDKWLRQEGYARYTTYFPAETSLQDLMHTMGMVNPGVYYMLSGLSPRGTQHVVICRGDAVLHDPHPDGGGIVGVGENDFWDVEVLVPLSQTTKRNPTRWEDLKLAYIKWKFNANWLRYLGVSCAMRRGRRWGEVNHHWGPFTYSPSDPRYDRTWAVETSSGGSGLRPCLRVTVPKGTLVLELPRGWPRNARKWVDTSNLVTYGPDGKVETRNPGSGYWQHDRREFGFRLSGSGGGMGKSADFLMVHFGRQTGDSMDTQDWCWFLPWLAYRHHSVTLLATNGLPWWTQTDIPRPLYFPWTKPRTSRRWDVWRANRGLEDDARREMEAKAPKQTFHFIDYDGAAMSATCRLYEAEYRRGEGWFAWMSLFWPHKVIRRYDIEFSGETGPRKGSWKGGTLACSGPVRDGDFTVEKVFRNYCAEHKMTFLYGVATKLDQPA